MPDIDLDFPVDFNPNKLFPTAIPASMVNKKNLLTKHPCGQYFQHIPIDPVTKLSAIPYEEAGKLGYFKIDFLHASVLDHFQSKQEIRELSKKEPDWNLLLDEDNVVKLIHIKNHYDLVSRVKPKSVQELADCLALIRPSKRYLISRYVGLNSRQRQLLRDELYMKPANNEIWFKRSHSIAYALTIIAQMHLISQGRL